MGGRCLSRPAFASLLQYKTTLAAGTSPLLLQIGGDFLFVVRTIVLQCVRCLRGGQPSSLDLRFSGATKWAALQLCRPSGAVACLGAARSCRQWHGTSRARQISRGLATAMVAMPAYAQTLEPCPSSLGMWGCGDNVSQLRGADELHG